MCQSREFGGINDQAGHWSVNHVPSTDLSGSNIDVFVWEILVVMVIPSPPTTMVLGEIQV